ncbi:MAG: hypothetical protein WBE92_14065 [Steroidobacteraceae bacterium]
MNKCDITAGACSALYFALNCWVRRSLSDVARDVATLRVADAAIASGGREATLTPALRTHRYALVESC